MKIRHNKTVLVVDDVSSIRLAIKDALSPHYHIYDAEDYDSALKILATKHIDLVITDIRMPGKSGLDLIMKVQEKYPNTLYALITAYNINDYIHFAKNHNVWNIIPKYSFLDMRLIEVMVEKLLSKEIFGVEKYFGNDFCIVEYNKRGFEKPPELGIIYKTITSDQERNELGNKITKHLTSKGAPNAINQIYEELTSNAMIRAPRDSFGEYKYQLEVSSSDKLKPMENITLSEGDYFDVGYGQYKSTYILTIRDKYGTLKKEDILRRLDRHITQDPTTGFPPGLGDSHGRGLYICREFSDHLIFNIKKHVTTEIIVFLEKGQTNGHKALSIYEID